MLEADGGGDDVAFFQITNYTGTSGNGYREFNVGGGPVYPTAFALDNDPVMNPSGNDGQGDFIRVTPGGLLIGESGFFDSPQTEPKVITRVVDSYDDNGRIDFGAWGIPGTLDLTGLTDDDSAVTDGRFVAYDPVSTTMFYFDADSGSNPAVIADVYLLNLTTGVTTQGVINGPNHFLERQGVRYFLYTPAAPVSITGWRSVRTHSGIGELAIALNATASGNGVSGPTVDPRATASLGGVQKIQIEFSGPVTLGNTAAITVDGRVTDGAGVMGPVSSYPPSSVVLSSPSTVDLLFSPALPDQGCFTVTVGAAAITGAMLSGDADVSIRTLWGDVTGDGQVVLGDALATKARIGQNVAPTNIPYDTNMAGGATVNLGDALAVKSRVSSPVRTAKCP